MIRNCTIYYDHEDISASISKDFESCEIKTVVTDLITRLEKIEGEISIRSIIFSESREV